VVGTAGAEDPPKLWLDGEPVTLEHGLDRTADGRRWIHVDDLRRALGVIVKQLIPRPPEGKRRDRRRERDSWILCGPDRCVTWRGETLGAERRPTFDAARVMRALGYRVRTRPDGIHLTTPWVGPQSKPRRAGIGARLGDLTLSCLDGRERRLAQYRGRRLLILTWASWSPTRDRLDAWRNGWPDRDAAKLDLLFVAIDVEGEKYVRDYVGVGFDEPVAVDRNADLGRRFSFQDVGHWFLVDEVGIVRAEGRDLGEVDRLWIEMHLEEDLLAVESLPPPLRVPDLESLRGRVAANPGDATARLALVEALERVDPKAARAEAAELVKRKPKSVPFAFRLARMHLDAGDAPGALRVLDDARRRLPNAWTLRKQYWALEEPARFYSGEIDLAWQRTKRKEESHFRRR
jgi:hypothetical protein